MRKRWASRVSNKGEPGPVPSKTMRPSFSGVGREEEREWREGDRSEGKDADGEWREERVTVASRSRGQYSDICDTCRIRV